MGLITKYGYINRSNKNSFFLSHRAFKATSVIARVRYKAVADPDLEIRGGPFCFVFLAGFPSFCHFFHFTQNKGGGGGANPRAPLLDPLQ